MLAPAGAERRCGAVGGSLGQDGTMRRSSSNCVDFYSSLWF